ncbi:carotenoid oxygenase family protein [Spirosoma sp. KUDC1026]|uniref:carotenoid oxygenase family protein n=1 Tax=Spirosoma sp. KUDC1026 TaxID=2745947 RepID=UPI00159BEA35|nr:carotenoid oxygenase family protein [Spirosoma sp. KUDC1026]QKZ14213.1 carotenoid oxygenase family protein [Spirosoma sp. KUDC1026]
MAIQHYKVLHDYVRANKTVVDEYDDVELQLLEGELPADLKGVLYRNGNGRFAHQGVWYDHLFDGDGMISRFEFDGQKVRYRNRYVRTREFLEEEKAGRMLHRSFGTNLPGGLLKNAFRMQFKNAANTSVVSHGGHMMALWEGGWPHRIDPVTLETIDRYDYDGVLKNRFSWFDSQIMPEMPFSAHPKIHPDTGVLYNFGTVAGTKQRLVLYKVSPGGKAMIDQIIEMDDMTFSHDFVVTQSGHRILFLTPVAFDMPRALLGFTSPAASIRVDRNKPTLILVIDPDGTIHRLTTDFCFVFHFVNGYQEHDGKLIVDGLMLDYFPASDLMKAYLNGDVADDGMGARFTRYTIDLATKQVTHTPLADYEGELPEIHPDRVGKPYQYTWGIGRPLSHSRPLADQLVKIDVTTGRGMHTGDDHTLPSEPIVVPRPASTAEDDAWLLYLRFDDRMKTTDLVVADAATLTTTARLRLPHNIPLGFHGLWLPEGGL